MEGVNEKKVHLGKGKFRNDTHEDIGYPGCLRTIDVMEMSEAVTTGTSAAIVLVVLSIITVDVVINIIITTPLFKNTYTRAIE